MQSVVYTPEPIADMYLNVKRRGLLNIQSRLSRRTNAIDTRFRTIISLLFKTALKAASFDVKSDRFRKGIKKFDEQLKHSWQLISAELFVPVRKYESVCHTEAY